MRVLVAHVAPPFSRDPRSDVASCLAIEFRAAGHEVDTLALPCSFDPTDAQIVALRLLDVDALSDRLICVGRPSHLLRHQSKVLVHLGHEAIAGPEAVAARECVKVVSWGGDTDAEDAAVFARSLLA